MKVLFLFLFSSFSYAGFEISHDIINCSDSYERCEVRVEFVMAEEDFIYTNSCYDIEPSLQNIQYCIEDLEVRAWRVLNNR